MQPAETRTGTDEAVFEAPPLGERVRRAFAEMPPSETEAQALTALLAHPGATAPELSALCGWRGGVWHAHFAALARRRRAVLSPGADGALLFAILADYEPGAARFSMKAEADEALRALGLGA